jgi:two-component system, NarL family, nitrate/nitrite response regulator NarL
MSMRRQPFSIVLIGSNALLREGLIHILSSARFRVVASTASLEGLAAITPARSEPLFLIIESNGDANIALPQIRSFKEQYPDGRVAVLGSRDRSGEMVAAFQAGANVYFDSQEKSEAFIKALELVMLGETILPPELLFYVRHPQGEERYRRIDRYKGEPEPRMTTVAEGDWPELSFRENCILRCIVEGASNKVIARQIDITEATVKVHVKAILRKIRVSNRTQAAIWAMKHAGQDSEDARSATKTSAILTVLSPNSPLQALSECTTENGGRGVTLAEVSRFIGPGLNGNSISDRSPWPRQRP